MTTEELKLLLENVKNGNIAIDTALQKIEHIAFEDIDIAMLDHHRTVRTGQPEVIYGASKNVDMLVPIVNSFIDKKENMLITRLNASKAKKLLPISENLVYNKVAKTMKYEPNPLPLTESSVCVVSAGTSDLPIVEEAIETLSILGNRYTKIVDVGVAGIHRLFSKIDIIREAKVIIAVAGMEGALASVVGGLVASPIVAVPTSVGYGSNMKGMTTLMAMLTSCTPNVSVVNIDNGFGAAYYASIINHIC